MNEDRQTEKKLVIFALIKAAIPVFLIIVAFFVQDDFAFLKGVHPLHTDGLSGIFTAALVHGDEWHLWGNISALIVLYFILFNSFRPMSWTVLVLTWVVPYLWLWFFESDAWHIGASGIVYALASFIFFSGLVVRHTRLIAQAMLIAFLYGGVFWGIFPGKPDVSWQGHLSGFLLGFLLALYYAKDLRVLYPKKKYFEDEEDDDEDDDDFDVGEFDDEVPQEAKRVKYHFKK
jgi:membrane associated rhomboid family serine protease